MFAKLLKYDLRAIGKTWWILAVTMLALSVGGGFCLRDLILNISEMEKNPTDPSGLATVLEMWGLMLIYIAIIVFFLITAILLFIRYYKNFFTDEGYLTFTLPVSKKQLYNAKLLNSIIWETATLVVVLLSVIIMLLIARVPEGDKSVMEFLIKDLLPKAQFYINVPKPWFGFWVAEVILILVLSILASVILTHLCITVGSVMVRKAKVVVALGLYYASSVAFGIVYSVCSFAYGLWFGSAKAAYPDAFINNNSLLITLGLLLVCVMYAVLIAVVYYVNLNCLERKLNLA